MTKFSFIHAADLHLDSPFKGVIGDDPEIGEAIYYATFDAFDSLVNLCIDKEVNFLLIAGDVYDSKDRSLRAQLKFRDGLERLTNNNIEVFVVHGNHDPLQGWSSQITWPSGVNIFSAEQVETLSVEINGETAAYVSGISYKESEEKRNLARLFQRKEQEIFHIGLLHCSVGKNPSHENYAPCTLDDLLDSGLDYWALGHFHEKAILNRGPHVVYPGNIQGRNIKEPGERGCYLVQVSDTSEIAMDFYPLDTIQWLSLSMSIDNLRTADQLDKALFRLLDRQREEVKPCSLICNVTLTGRGPLYKELARDGAVETLLYRLRESHGHSVPFAFVQRLTVNCGPEFDMESIKSGRDFSSQVLRVAEDLMQQDIEERLKPVLASLYENPRGRQFLAYPDTGTLKLLIEGAQRLSLYKLDEES